MVLVLVTLVLYTYGIISMRFRSRPLTRYAVALLAGVSIDWYTSWQMSRAVSKEWSVHVAIGRMALLMMTVLVFPAGYQAYRYFRYDASKRAIALMRGYGLYAYTVWVVSFITGALMGMGVIPWF